jgi:hypothetical protein
MTVQPVYAVSSPPSVPSTPTRFAVLAGVVEVIDKGTTWLP